MEKDNFKNRPPVVVVMGHVDHGKSSILEAIKDLKITGKESGGITQHIGAYEIEHQNKKITFLDTPGHEAFSSMRSRGARVADIAVLVVAADDGVKEQTKEAIKHINDSEIPLIVAINKIDKNGASVDRIVQELSMEGIYTESIGGKVPSVSVSAKTKENISELLEMILLVAEVEDFKANFSETVKGVVVEAHLDPLKGPTATLIIESGTLNKQDVIATKTVKGKVKTIEDFKQESIEEATPSMPVIIRGFEDVPSVGDEFSSFESLTDAKNFISENLSTKKDKKDFSPKPGAEQLSIIIKADFLGTIEAIEGMLAEIPQERVFLKILKAEVGDINESDVKLSKSFNAPIIGFKTKIPNQINVIIERESVKVKNFDIIYELVGEIRKMMEDVFTPRIEKVDIGEAKALVIFFTEKNKQIVGCRVLQGEIRKQAFFTVLRKQDDSEEEQEVGKGKINGLKIGTKDFDKVNAGEECGISCETSVKIEEGDLIKVYIKEEEVMSGF